MSGILESVVKKIKDKQQKIFARGLLGFAPEKELMDMVSHRDIPNLIAQLYDTFSLFSGKHVSVFPQGDGKVAILAHVPDKAFLVDTLGEEIHARGYEILHTFHPVFLTKRDEKGRLKSFSVKNGTQEKGDAECFIYIEIDCIADETRLADLCERLHILLEKVDMVNADFVDMQNKLRTTREILSNNHTEEQAFLEWLDDGHFIFLGYRHYALMHEKKRTCVQTTKGSGLGLLKSDQASSSYHKTCLTEIPPNLRYYFEDDNNALTVTKTLDKSPIHRRAYMDYIGVKETDSQGRIIGEHRFIGLFTAKAYAFSPLETPMVRQKIEAVMAHVDMPNDSHNQKALMGVLQTYPRDDLFQIGIDDLARIATGVVKLKERHDVRAFIRHARHERLVTMMVFIPRDRMNSALRRKIVAIAREAYHAEDIEFMTTLGESRLARLYMRIRSLPPETPEIADNDVENRIIQAARLWDDELSAALMARYGAANGKRLYNVYNPSLGASYKEYNSVADAMTDIDIFECGKDFDVAIENLQGHIRLKIFRRKNRIALSELMPTFQRLGLFVRDERSTEMAPQGKESLWIHDFELHVLENQDFSESNMAVLSQALHKTWQGKLEK